MKDGGTQEQPVLLTRGSPRSKEEELRQVIVDGPRSQRPLLNQFLLDYGLRTEHQRILAPCYTPFLEVQTQLLPGVAQAATQCHLESGTSSLAAEASGGWQTGFYLPLWQIVQARVLGVKGCV